MLRTLPSSIVAQQIDEPLKFGEYISIVGILFACELGHIHMVRMYANGCVPVKGRGNFWPNFVRVSVKASPKPSC